MHGGEEKRPTCMAGICGPIPCLSQLPLSQEFREKIKQETARKKKLLAEGPSAERVAHHVKTTDPWLRPQACPHALVPGTTGNHQARAEHRPTRTMLRRW